MGVYYAMRRMLCNGIQREPGDAIERSDLGDVRCLVSQGWIANEPLSAQQRAIVERRKKELSKESTPSVSVLSPTVEAAPVSIEPAQPLQEKASKQLFKKTKHKKRR